MIAAVMNFTDQERTVIVVVIEPENLQRMSTGDPATLETESLGGILPPVLYPNNYAVLIAYEQDEVELYKKARENPVALLQYLERGRRFLPGDGTENAFKVPKPWKNS